jgi:PAS domain S-box-containing protein
MVMANEKRRIGINIVDNSPWGTHYCQFYQNKEDLIDLLVPYFKAGLEDNEFCMWITSDPLGVEEAEASLRKAVKNLDEYFIKGQIEIIDYSEVYTKTGTFDADATLQSWVEKEHFALDKGFNGIRLSGNTFWLEPNDWKYFTEYEEAVDSVIDNHRMLAICSYSLEKCTATEVIEVMSKHQIAFIRDRGKWRIIMSDERKQAEEMLSQAQVDLEKQIERRTAELAKANEALLIEIDGYKRLEEDNKVYLAGIENAYEGIVFTKMNGDVLYFNKAACKILDYTSAEMKAINISKFSATSADEKKLEESLIKKGKFYGEISGMRKSGEIFPAILSVSIVKDGKGKLIGRMGVFTDITERKQAEEAVKENEGKLRIMFESVTDGITVTDMNGVITDANERTMEIHRFGSKEELLGKNAFDFITSFDHERAMVNMQRTLEEGAIRNIEYTLLREDGSEFPGELSASVLNDTSGNPIGFIAVTRDITERMIAEAALKESEEKFRTFMETASDLMHIADKEAKLTYVNVSMAKTLGYSKEELIGMPVTQIFSEDALENVFEEMAKTIIQKGEISLEQTWLTKDGEEISGELKIVAIYDDHGKFVGTRGVFRDITEIKQMMEALRVSEQNFRNSLDNSPYGVRIVTAEGELLYANQAILDIYGYSSVEELATTPSKERYTPESYTEHRKRKRRRKQGKPVPSNYEISIIRKDGKVRHLTVTRNEIIWDGEKEFQTLYRDITENKRIALAVRRSEEINRSLFMNSPNPILVINDDTSIRYMNPALEKMTGFRSAKVNDTLPPYPWWIKTNNGISRKKLLNAMRRGKSKYEQLLRAKDGREFWVEVNFETVETDGDSRYHIANWVDLTERKRLEENMKYYISQVTMAQEEERKRISREMHDESIQSLAALVLSIDAMAKDTKVLPANIGKRIKGFRDEIESVLGGLRNFSHELRPGVIDHVGLVPALEILVEELNNQMGIRA